MSSTANLAVFNPHNKPVTELPVIYGFNNGGSYEWYTGFLLSEDGEGLGSHICSSEWFMPGDLGCLEGSRPDRHEDFRKHYPDGYRMEFVPERDVKTHPGLTAAYNRNQEEYAAQVDVEAAEMREEMQGVV